jgi:hypothetical protein
VGQRNWDIRILLILSFRYRWVEQDSKEELRGIIYTSARLHPCFTCAGAKKDEEEGGIKYSNGTPGLHPNEGLVSDCVKSWSFSIFRFIPHSLQDKKCRP